MSRWREPRTTPPRSPDASGQCRTRNRLGFRHALSPLSRGVRGPRAQRAWLDCPAALRMQRRDLHAAPGDAGQARSLLAQLHPADHAGISRGGDRQGPGQGTRHRLNGRGCRAHPQARDHPQVHRADF